MKTKNDLTNGIIIGIGMIVIPLILMSTTYVTNKQGVYEIHNKNYLLNTQTGDVWWLDGINETKRPFHVYEKSTIEKNLEIKRNREVNKKK